MQIKKEETMKKHVNKPLIISLLIVLLIPCTWFGLIQLHAYKRDHFPQWISLHIHITPAKETAVWRVNGKEFGLYECPSVPGYVINVTDWDSIQIKEELGCGLYILYTIHSFLAESELKFFNYTISSIFSNSPLEIIYYYY